MPTGPYGKSPERDFDIGRQEGELLQRGELPGAALLRGPTGLRMPNGTEPRSAAFRRIARSLGPYRKLEHLCAKDVDDHDGRLVPNGRVAWTPMFASSATSVIATAMRSVQRHQPPSTTVSPSTLLGEVPPGEAGHYHIHTGIDFIHWIGSPYYLLTDEDTLDKLEQTQLGDREFSGREEPLDKFATMAQLAETLIPG